jgi:hypothetical protein
MTVRDIAEQGETLIFLHIYKAAGTTLRKIIEHNYDPSAVYIVDIAERKSFSRFKELAPPERKRFAVMQGHVKFGLHELIPRPATYLTMLRDPVDRVLSDYYFILRATIHPLYEQVTLENMTLRDYIRSKKSLSVDNGQVRVLCGEPDVAYGNCSRAMLEEAKYNLENHFSFVGLAERFDESVVMMKRTFGWKMPLYVRHNVTRDRPRKEHIPEDILRLIEEGNALDIELYRFASDLFGKSLAGQSNSFKAELLAFKCANAMYGRLYPGYRALRRAGGHTLSFLGLEELVRSRLGRNGRDS